MLRVHTELRIQAAEGEDLPCPPCPAARPVPALADSASQATALPCPGHVHLHIGGLSGRAPSASCVQHDMNQRSGGERSVTCRAFYSVQAECKSQAWMSERLPVTPFVMEQSVMTHCWQENVPAEVEEGADRSQQLKHLIVDGNIAQGWWEGALVLKREVVHLHRPIFPFVLGQRLVHSLNNSLAGVQRFQ